MREGGIPKEKIYANREKNQKPKPNPKVETYLFTGQAEKEFPKKHETGRRNRREAKGVGFKKGLINGVKCSREV